MSKKFNVLAFLSLAAIILTVSVVASMRRSGIVGTAQMPPPGTIVVPITEEPNNLKEDSLQLRTFPFATVPPTPTPTNKPIPPTIPPSTPNNPVNPGTPPGNTPPGVKIPITSPLIGGPTQPNGPNYCIDDHDPDMCDDNSSHLVPKGAGGISGSCGTVIAQAHRLVNALPQYMKGLRNQLTTNVSNCGYSTGPGGGYVQTHFVIDAYNLAGLTGLSKSDPNHVSPTGMFNWWQSAPGYVFVPYSPAVVQEYGEGKRSLTGCAMFLKTSSYHIGIVNTLELFTPGGDGVISILQSGTSMYIDRFPVAGWGIRNSSTNMTNTSGVAGFGCHT